MAKNWGKYLEDNIKEIKIKPRALEKVLIKHKIYEEEIWERFGQRYLDSKAIGKQRS